MVDEKGWHSDSHIDPHEVTPAQAGALSKPESLADYCERRAREIREASEANLSDLDYSDVNRIMADALIASAELGAARALEEIATFERRQGR